MCLSAHPPPRCVELVGAYLQESSPEARLLVGGDMRKIQLCFQLMKVGGRL